MYTASDKMPYAAPFQTDPCRLAYRRDIKNGNRSTAKNKKGGNQSDFC